MSASCSCGKALGRKNKSGRCRACFMAHLNSDSAIHARRIDGCKQYARTNRATVLERCRRAAVTKSKNTEHLAWLAEQMRTRIQPLAQTPEAIARRDYKQIGKSISETKLAWCPPAYRKQYRDLIRSGFRKAEAQPMILDQIKVDTRGLDPLAGAIHLKMFL